MLIAVGGERFPRSVGTAAASPSYRSDGAKTCVGNSFYQHHAPTERKTSKTCVATNGRGPWLFTVALSRPYEE